MKFLAFFLIIFSTVFCLQSESITSKEKDKNTNDLKFILSTTHASFSNWQGGGINSLNISFKLDGDFKKSQGKWSQIHDLELGYGVLKQETLNLQKADDQIHYSYNLGFSPLKNQDLALNIIMDFRSQFSSGFNYKKNPFPTPKDLPVKVSDFFSPAYFTQSLNIAYNQKNWLNSSLGFGIKQTIVNNPEFRQLFGVSEDKVIRFEYGISSKIKFDKEIAKNLQMDSQFDFFYSVNPLQKPDIRWNNKLDMKFNSWFSIRFELEMFYDQDILNKLQIREVMSLGVTLPILDSKKV